jgi:16S rRNA (uracil1498-N3)-methyltransferase
MQIHRIYEPKFSTSEYVHLEGENSHIVSSVLRLKPGDSLTLLNGEGLTGEGILKEVGKKKSGIQIQKIHTSKTQIPKLTLFQAIPKADKLEWVIQKGVEWGIQQMVLLSAAHSVTKKINLSRILKIAVEALRQSETRFCLISMDLWNLNQRLKNFPQRCRSGLMSLNGKNGLKK